MKIVKGLFGVIGFCVIFSLGILIVPYACFSVYSDGLRDEPLDRRGALRFLGISEGDGVLFDKGVLIHVGRDFVAYGKYQMEDYFSEEEFIRKYGLTDSLVDGDGYFCRQSIEVDWFVVSPEMRKMQRADFLGNSFLMVWIDNLNRVIFVERAGL